MTDKTETPEGIWIDPKTANNGSFANRIPVDVEYTRKDLSDAKIAEAEQRGYARAMDAERKDADARIAELEAKMAKVVKLMDMSVDMATWNTTLLDDVIFFTSELKGTNQ